MHASASQHELHDALVSLFAVSPGPGKEPGGQESVGEAASMASGSSQAYGLRRSCSPGLYGFGCLGRGRRRCRRVSRMSRAAEAGSGAEGSVILVCAVSWFRFARCEVFEVLPSWTALAVTWCL